VYGIVPLIQVLLTLTRYRPFPRVIFEFKAVLVPLARFQLVSSGYQGADPCILQRYQVEILVLSTSGVFLVVVELLTQEHKLSLFESMAVQRFLV